MFSKHMTPDKWETVAEHEGALLALAEGDQLWRFRSQEEPLLGWSKCEGIAISRNGEVVTSLITRWIDRS